jgi:two-component system phosphate regulon sensor histidine kinase PhoR
MTKRIFRIIFAARSSPRVLASALIMLTLYQSYTGSWRTAQGGGRLLIYACPGDRRAAYFRNFHGDSRVTLVAPDGTVLYDSTADAEQMENHLSRPEIKAALAGGSGQTHRYSVPLPRKRCTLPCAPTTATCSGSPTPRRCVVWAFSPAAAAVFC